jgi:hypothetical protein
MTAQEGESQVLEDQRNDKVEKRALSIWAGLGPGDVVSLRVPEARDYTGTVECSTNDGLIIWIRDDLHERRLFHFRDCRSFAVLTQEKSSYSFQSSRSDLEHCSART